MDSFDCIPRGNIEPCRISPLWNEGRYFYLIWTEPHRRRVRACFRLARRLRELGIELSTWRIHRHVSVSGGLILNAVQREPAPS